jgi:hypothetical protein
VRDQGCLWPGCDRPPSWTNPHHVLFWGHGGNSNVPNLVLLCHRHHWNVHEGGWQVVKSEGGRVLAIPPSYPFPSYVAHARTRAPDTPAPV